MDAEQTREVVDADSETPQQQEAGMEKVVVSKLDTPEESTEPEKSLATVEETLQLAANGQDAEQLLTSGKETDQSPESVKPLEKMPEVETQDNLPKKMSEQATLPDMPPEKKEEAEETETLLDVVKRQPESVGSPEKSSDPVTATNTEPESTQLDQQPMSANTPEPLLLHKPLAENAPEPEPDKFVEAIPEAPERSGQALPGPVTLLKPEEHGQLSQVEEVSGQAEAEGETVVDTLPKEVVKEVLAVTDVAALPKKELEPEKPVEAEPPKVEMGRPEEVGAGELVEAEAAKEMVLDKPAESETVNETPAETEKEPEKPVEAEAVKGAEASAAEGEVEEEKVPAPGSLSFALLEQEQTKVVVRTSRTLIVLRGLPGSGKSLLARAIADGYQDLCSVVCADDHGIKPENPEASSNGYKALDEAVVACCSAGPTASVVVVVDDTNHTHDRLARLGEIAEQHRLVAMFLEPRTEWNRDSSQLAKRTGRGLEEAQIQAMKGPFEEMSLPLYFGWFLVPNIQDKVRCTSMDFLKTLDTLEAFKKHSIDCECRMKILLPVMQNEIYQ